jgi:hypothetical protein
LGAAGLADRPGVFPIGDQLAPLAFEQDHHDQAGEQE